MITTARILGWLSGVLGALALVSLFIVPSIVGLAALGIGAIGAATALVVYCIGRATELILDRIDQRAREAGHVTG